jgi:hypothetical protein
MFSKKMNPILAAIFIASKVDIRVKSVRRDNEGHFILIKGRILQEEFLTYMYQT